MDKTNLEEKFWNLCKVADEEDAKNLGMTSEFESTLLNILDFVKANINEKELFKNCFVQSWTSEDHKTTHWVVLFCMRELRWPEVQNEINDFFVLRGGIEGAPRLMNFISDLNLVYDDTPWEDADFFNYHWEREHPGKPWPLEANNA
jgi:hypothetical protein